MLLHFILVLFILPLYISSFLIVPILTYKYKLGHFPKYLKYYDNFSANYMREHNLKVNGFHMRTRLGQLGSETLEKYNKTYLLRTYYAVIRHPVDYYKQRVIRGKTKLL